MRLYSEYLRELFPESLKVQKISVNLGFSCPNRDGTIGVGGCIYCNNTAFSPEYCHTVATVTEQIERGKRFFARKYPEMDYLVYFQNYTSTYSSLDTLEEIYRTALRAKGVVGLVIGTRPDYVSDEFLKMAAALPVPVIMEYGAESSHDVTLRLINRGHSWADTCDAVRRTSAAGLHCGLHFINGLPGESIDDILITVKSASELPVQSLKFHHLQILKGTNLADNVDTLPPMLSFTPESYLELCRRIIELVPSKIVIERFLAQAPPDMVIAPRWGIRNYEFMHKLINH